MTRAELAAALRERFSALRGDSHPELVEVMRGVTDDRVIQAHVRCGACRRFHTTVAEAVAAAAACADVTAFMDAMQARAVQRWPRACLRRLDAMERAIQGERPS